MEDIRTRPLSAIDGPSWRRNLPQALVMAYILIAIIAYLAIPFLALDWIKQPFIGAFVEQTMVFNGTRPSSNEVAWPAIEEGLTFGYQLLAIDGQPVRNSGEIKAILRNHQPGDQVTLSVRSPRGETAEHSIELISFPIAEQLTFFYLPFLIGLVYWPRQCGIPSGVITIRGAPFPPSASRSRWVSVCSSTCTPRIS
jgi:hypothetical protein